MERTFGPQVVFHKASSEEQGDNLAPCYRAAILRPRRDRRRTGSLTVTLKDVDDRALWSTTLDPAPAAPACNDHDRAYRPSFRLLLGRNSLYTGRNRGPLGARNV